MKLPRDVSGKALVTALLRMGYEKVRQDGSHVRLTHPGPPQHHLTIPLHPQLRPGLLAAILDQVAASHHMSRQGVILQLFE